MSMLRARLFGGLALTWDQDPLPVIPNPAARSLLAYLITHRDRPHTRDLLAGSFWPDLPDATARRRLSKALWQTRHAFRQAQDQAPHPQPVLVTAGDTVQLNPGLPLWLDVEEFTRHSTRCTSGEAGALEHCTLCIEQYQGEFLAGYYDDWAVLERERLREMFLLALARLVAGYKSRGDDEPALVYARRLAAEDPWREGAHREVMRLCHLLGQDAAALEQFAVCRRALAEHLGAEPSPETIALAGEIAARSGLSEPPVLPSIPRPVTTPLLERPDRLPLVGRQAELGELLRQMEAAAKGDGGLVIIYGEAGVGKSRLLRELAENARWRGVPAAWGRSYELAAPLAYQPLVEALRASLPDLTESELEPLWRAELSRLLPELATEEGVPPPLTPEEEKRRLLEAIARAYLCLAEIAPHLVLLEDTHWMDPASLEALRYLLPRLADARLLFVITARPEELAGQELTHQPATALSAMEGTRLPRRLELGRLNQAETEELMQRALDLEQPAPLFSARLHAETAGNPFFLIETLRMLIDDGLLYRDETGDWSTPWDESTENYAELPLPAEVTQSIGRRLERLPDRLNQALDLAATVGREVGFELWRSASGWDEEALLMAGDALCAQGLLLAAEADRAGVDYVFTHDQIRRVAYDRLAAPRRRLYHRQVAQALTDLARDEPSALAHHWMRAEVWDKAAEYHQAAGDRARAVSANTEAVVHYTQALAALERLPELVDPARKYDLHLAREAVYDLLGEREAQAQDLQVLQTLTEALDDDLEQAARWQAKVALRQAHLGEVTGDYPAAIAAAQAVVGLTRRVQDRRSEVAGYLVWGRALWQQGEKESAHSKLERAMELAQRASSRQMQAESLGALGNFSYGISDYTGARSHWEQAIVLYREVGDRRGESATLSKLGLVSWSESAYVEAKAHYEQALLIDRETGDRYREGNALGNLGIVSAELGDYAAARAFYEEALKVQREIGDRQGESNALNSLGWLCESCGDFQEARSFSQQALDISREIGARRGEGWALLNLGRVYHRVGDSAAASSHFKEALQIYREVGYRRYEGLLLLNLSFVRHDRGEFSQASVCLERALDIFRATGSRQFEGWGLNHMGVLSATQGDYRGAKAYYEQALSIFREIGDLRSEGRGLANLALLSHHLGDDVVACQYGQRALEAARKVSDRPLQSDAFMNLGHALAGLGRLSEAANVYRQAADIRQELSQPHIAMQPSAGLACVSLAQDDLTQAMAYVEEILEHLKTKTPSSGFAQPPALHPQRDARDPEYSEQTGHALEGNDEPLRIYLTCYQVLQANKDPRTQEVLTTAYDLLQDRAAKITDEALRHSFLENVAINREIVAAFRERQAPQQERQARPGRSRKITVSLPRADAPLGRPLRDDEYVAVTWTVAVPKDEAIAGKAARRHQRILRLLDEAQVQGAAPTHSHLAEALGVSRRTIERDIALLRSQEHVTIPPTRGKMSE